MKHSTITILVSDETPMADLDQLFRAIAELGHKVHQIAPGQTLAAPREWRVETKRLKRNPSAKIRAAADLAIAERVIH
jgi:hypothetical protein